MVGKISRVELADVNSRVFSEVNVFLRWSSRNGLFLPSDMWRCTLW